ncbi:MAG: acyltransferase [Colwellia sp.]|uniref:LpxL/LpxP family acyltransferase n=1 Tax=Colwellia sp. TaxID=56799 RepID=UPI0025C407CE|nr:acyltransferase [Colwellia sp.]NQZ28151.1 acyltransferase [Colwellia sp.]
MTTTSHWSSMGERGSKLGLKTFLLFYQYGGRYLALLILYPVILYFFITGKTSRTASQKYLAKLHQAGYLAKKPNLWLSFKHFLAMGFAALDKVDVWLGKISMNSINHINYAIFEPLLVANKGALIIGSHLGNLEVCRALANDNTGACFNVLVFTEHAQQFNELINSLNSDVKVNLIEVTEMGPALAIMLQEKINQGEYVVIAGDRTSTTVASRVIYHDFLGEQAPFSQGPFILAGILQCPVLMMFCLKAASSSKHAYDLIFEELSPGVHWRRKTRDLELSKLVKKYAETLEKYCARYPLQWFNFFDFWQQDSINSNSINSNNINTQQSNNIKRNR